MLNKMNPFFNEAASGRSVDGLPHLPATAEAGMQREAIRSR